MNEHHHCHPLQDLRGLDDVPFLIFRVRQAPGFGSEFTVLMVPAGLGWLTLVGLADPSNSPCVPGVFSALHFCLGNWCPRHVIQRWHVG